MPCREATGSVAHPMAKTRAKNKAKSAKSKKTAPKKKVALKAKAVKSVKVKAKAKKLAPKKVAKAAPKKKVVAKAAPAKATAPRRIVPKATPMSPPRKPLAPEVDRALAQADVEGLISRLPPPVQPVVKTLRRLVLEAAPEASELLDDGSPAYFANGMFARIVPSEREVLVRFLRGGALPSAAELAGEGESREITLTSLSEIKENVLRKLVREAVMLNLSTPVIVQA